MQLERHAERVARLDGNVVPRGRLRLVGLGDAERRRPEPPADRGLLGDTASQIAIRTDGAGEANDPVLSRATARAGKYCASSPPLGLRTQVGRVITGAGGAKFTGLKNVGSEETDAGGANGSKIATRPGTVGSLTRRVRWGVVTGSTTDGRRVTTSMASGSRGGATATRRGATETAATRSAAQNSVEIESETVRNEADIAACAVMTSLPRATDRDPGHWIT